MLTVTLDIAGGDDTTGDVFAAINAGSDFDATALTGGTETVAATNAGTGTLVGGRDTGSADITVTADTAGIAANNVNISILETGNPNANTAAAAIESGHIVVRVNGTVTKAAIAAAIDGLTGYSASANVTGDANYISASDAPAATPAGTLTNGADAGGGISHDVTLQVGGSNGVEIFTFQAGTSIASLTSAISAFSDATGVTATTNGTTLELESTGYGSDAFVDVKILSENASGTFTQALGSANSRDAGADVVATVNGISALGKGNVISLATSSLFLSTTVEGRYTRTIAFKIHRGVGLCSNSKRNVLSKLTGPPLVINQLKNLGWSGGVSPGKLFPIFKKGWISLSLCTTIRKTALPHLGNKAD